MDFGAAAHDYQAHRQGFPPSLFERLPLVGRILDLGSGTGSLASGYAARGAEVIAVDISCAMLRQGPSTYAKLIARAEACPFADRTFDAAIAGQCWHWFDGPRAARECARLVRPGGTVAIVHLDYLLVPGGVAEATEALILEVNPGWPLAGGDRIYEKWRPHLEGAGLGDIRSFGYDEDLVYTRDAWRGRIRACNGVIAVPNPLVRAGVDERLGDLLAARFPERMPIPHRISVIAGRVPATA